MTELAIITTSEHVWNALLWQMVLPSCLLSFWDMPGARFLLLWLPTSFFLTQSTSSMKLRYCRCQLKYTHTHTHTHTARERERETTFTCDTYKRKLTLAHFGPRLTHHSVVSLFLLRAHRFRFHNRLTVLLVKIVYVQYCTQPQWPQRLGNVRRCLKPV